MANPLPTPLISLFEQSQPESRVQRVWQGIRARREAKHQWHWVRQQPKLLAALCTVAVVVIAALFARPWRTQAQEHAIVVPTSIDATSAERRLDFGYGAIIRVATGAKLDVLEQSERSVVLALRHGITHYDIRPGGPRRYRIESGGVSVEVVGTQFDVERAASAVKVNVQRGRVLVRGPGVPDSVQALDAGRELVVTLVPDKEVSVEPQPSDTTTPAKAEARGPAIKAPTLASANKGANPVGDDWRAAATRHEWNLAWQSLGSEGLAREVARTDDVADLLALADVARLTGHPNDALKPLRQIVGGHPEDPRSAMAAFTLGRVLLDSLGNPVQAAFAFERAMSLKLPASLAEDAQARLVEAHARSGAVVQARTAANTYRARYPAGRRLADVNHWSPPE